MGGVTGTQVIDGNVHLAAPSSPDSAAADGWRSDWPDGHTLTTEEYEKVMAVAGIARAVLTTSVRRDGFNNSYTAAAAAGDPARFAFVGNFDVLAPGAAAAIEHQASRFAMRGARFYGGAAADAATWLGDDRATMAWTLASRLGLVVSAQRTRAANLGPLRAMVKRFPDVPVVVHSAGDPAPGPGLDAVCTLARWPNILIMLASKNWSAAGPDFLRRLVDAFGPRRLMWGSYSQFTGARLSGHGPSLPDLVADVRERLGFLSTGDLSWVLGVTAERTFWPE